jgi:hypothetical protein
MECYLNFCFIFPGITDSRDEFLGKPLKLEVRSFWILLPLQRDMPTLTSSNLNLNMLSAWLGKLKPKDWSSLKLERLTDHVEH